MFNLENSNDTERLCFAVIIAKINKKDGYRQRNVRQFLQLA